METCVLVSNATIAFNTVMRNLVFEPGDVIIIFATIYGACEKTVTYITETTPAEVQKINFTYPVSDDDLCHNFETSVEDLKSKGKTPKIAVFDTIVSLPGVRMPFEHLTQLCKQHKILSCIDGAHGAGHIPLNLSELDPDFFTSNAHKWLYVPRGCAVFYVPKRNQHLIRSTIPTSHGFIPLPTPEGGRINNPLPPSNKSDFVTNFEFVGTLDNSPYLCIPAALSWRRRLSWQNLQGDDAIFAYLQHLAHRSGEIVSAHLGTKILENDAQTLGRCSFSNVLLPLSVRDLTGGDVAKAVEIGQWIAKVLIEEYETFIAIIFYGNAWWVRLSAQVYLTEADFEWAGRTLEEVCGRVNAGEWKGKEAAAKL